MSRHHHLGRAITLVALTLSGAALADGPAPHATTPTTQTTGQTTAQTTTSPAPTIPAAEGARAFLDVARVLQSPRCMNCHPVGDRPLQTDRSVPHAMNISRATADAGMPCSTCHGVKNADDLGVPGGPPGAPHWQLPPKDTPMIFQGLTPAALCAQLKRPKDTGGRDLDALLKHVSHDPLVLWGWKPGGKRTVPPLDHKTFVARFATWVASGGACPPQSPPLRAPLAPAELR